MTRARAGEGRDRPGVLAPPPLIYAVCFAAGLLLRSRIPARLFAGSLGIWLGWLLMLPSLVIALAAVRVMFRAGTAIAPHRPTTRLVTGGPFRWSRNPLYLSLTLLFTGLALLSNSLWPLLSVLPAAAILQLGVIHREERYLEGKFEDAYRSYKSRVRRWI